MKQIRAAVKAICSYLPPGKLNNEQLAQEPGMGDWDATKIFEKTGISVRSIASRDECASDLGVAAAQQLFRNDGYRPDEVDFLLFCTQSPDYFLPTTACTLQDRLGLPTSCGAIDFNQGCSGFVYGLALAKSLIETGTATNVLLITAETYSKFINSRDRSARTIFGDGAAAAWVGPLETDTEMIGPFVFGTDGRGAQNLIVPAGGLRCPPTPETAVEKEEEGGNWRSAQNLYMNGPEIFNFTLKAVPLAIEQLAHKWGQPLGQVDYFIFHQANKFMLERLRGKLKIPTEKFWLNLETCGNTVSSTIPLALQSARNQGQIRPGNKVMLVGFGVGYSWAAAMIQIS
jgi:3-oxoacyl-[acyl-carrier-protein] synthase III